MHDAVAAVRLVGHCHLNPVQQNNEEHGARTHRYGPSFNLMKKTAKLGSVTDVATGSSTWWENLKSFGGWGIRFGQVTCPMASQCEQRDAALIRRIPTYMQIIRASSATMPHGAEGGSSSRVPRHNEGTDFQVGILSRWQLCWSLATRPEFRAIRKPRR